MILVKSMKWRLNGNYGALDDVLVSQHTQKWGDMIARIRYWPVGERRVVKTVEILCVPAHTRAGTLGGLDSMKQIPRLGGRFRLRNLNELGHWF